MTRRSRPAASRRSASRVLIDAGFGESAGADDHAVRALLEQRLGAFDGAHAAADAADGLGGEHPHQFVIRAAADGGVEIDHLDLRESGELAQHFVRAIALQRLLAALDELHHLAVHQVDARDDHAATRTGMPRLSSSSFSWFTV